MRLLEKGSAKSAKNVTYFISGTLSSLKTENDFENTDCNLLSSLFFGLSTTNLQGEHKWKKSSLNLNYIRANEYKFCQNNCHAECETTHPLLSANPTPSRPKLSQYRRRVF